MTSPSFDIENQFPQHIVCGVDEAGRGPLAGPVVAAAVILPSDFATRTDRPLIRDSKKMNETQKQTAYQWLQHHAEIGVGLCNVEEIDRLNILQASLRAMEKAVIALPRPPTIALIDGNKTPKSLPPECQAQSIIKGDSISYSIAAASVIAKVERDKIMRALCTQHSVYGWSRNAGYGTAEHLMAIARFGITTHHRTTFAPVRKIIEQ